MSAVDIMEELENKHRYVVTMIQSHHWDNAEQQYSTKIRLLYLKSFSGADNDELAAKRAASTDAVGYLNKLADRVIE